MQQLVSASRRLSPASSRQMTGGSTAQFDCSPSTPYAGASSLHHRKRLSLDVGGCSHGLDREAFMASKGMMCARGEPLSPPPGMSADRRFSLSPDREGVDGVVASRSLKREASWARRTSGVLSPLSIQTQNEEAMEDTFSSLPTAVQALTSPSPTFLMCRTSGAVGGAAAPHWGGGGGCV